MMTFQNVSDFNALRAIREWSIVGFSENVRRKRAMPKQISEQEDFKPRNSTPQEDENELKEVQSREKLISVNWGKLLIHEFYNQYDQIVSYGLLRVHRDVKGREFVYPSELARQLQVWGEINIDAMLGDEKAEV